MITSRQNPRIKEFMQLAKKSKDGRVLAEGVHILKDALDSNIEIESILLVPRKANEEVEESVAVARSRGIEIVEMSEDCYKKFSQLKSSESVALVYKFDFKSLDSFFVGNKKVVVLDAIQDPGNAGAIMRIAEATGMDGCVFVGGTSVTNGKFIRATMGAVFRIPCINISFEEFEGAIKNISFRLVATELDKTAIPFDKVNYNVVDSSLGVCFGSEGNGVSEKMLKLSAERVYIPMCGSVESLNVAVAVGIVLYHVGNLFN